VRRFLRTLALAALIAARPAMAAQVERVLSSKSLVLLKVAKGEQADLRPGTVVTVRFKGRSETAEVEVQGVEPGRIKAFVLFGMAELRAGDEVRLDASEVASPERQSRFAGEAPALAITKAPFNAYGHPFVFAGRLRPRYDYLASHLYQLEQSGFTAYFRQERWLSSQSASDRAVRTRADYKAFGLTPLLAIVTGVRLGAGFDVEEYESKVKLSAPGAADVTTAPRWALTSFTAHAAYPWKSRAVFGLKYSASRVKLAGGGGQGSESFANVEASVGLLEKTWQAHLAYHPEINVSRGDAALRRPVTWTLAYRQQQGPGGTLLVDARHAAKGGVESASGNAQGLRVGYAQALGKAPLLGGLVGYEHRHYAAASGANPDNVPRLSATLFARYSTDVHTHYAFLVEGEAGEGKGRSPGGNTDRIKIQGTTWQVSMGRLF
jgi:hypothetical protein